MGLLLGDSDFREDIENSLAFDFQLPGQIVNSNLTHPPFLCPATAPYVFIATSRSQRCMPARRLSDERRES